MIDVQNRADHRNISVDKVGVKDIRYPVTVMDKRNGVQHTVASINMYVNLPREFKGTHMSRFIELLNEFHGHLDIREFSSVLEALQDPSPVRICPYGNKFSIFHSKALTCYGKCGFDGIRLPYSGFSGQPEGL